MNSIKAFIEALFAVPTVEDDVAQRKAKAAEDIRHSDAMMHKARYQKHMALSELTAIARWERGEFYSDNREET